MTGRWRRHRVRRPRGRIAERTITNGSHVGGCLGGQCREDGATERGTQTRRRQAQAALLPSARLAVRENLPQGC